jgi:hypothetical protein
MVVSLVPSPTENDNPDVVDNVSVPLTTESVVVIVPVSAMEIRFPLPVENIRTLPAPTD